MKKYLLFIVVVQSLSLKAQHAFSAAAGVNFGQLPYQCYEMFGMAGTADRNWLLQASLNYTAAGTNGTQFRNVKDFDSRYMQSTDDVIKGFGYGFSLRKMFRRDESKPISTFIGAGLMKYNYDIDFYENEYKPNPSGNGYYNYTPVLHQSSFSRMTIDFHLGVHYSSKDVFGELSLGVAQYSSKIPDAVNDYRNYHFSNIDYGFTGIGPVFALRLGVWVY